MATFSHILMAKIPIVYTEYLVSQIFGNKEKIAIGYILIWHYGGVVLGTKWRLSLVCKVITFMATFGVQNVSDVLNCEQKTGNPNDSYAVVITKKPFPMQTTTYC